MPPCSKSSSSWPRRFGRRFRVFMIRASKRRAFARSRVEWRPRVGLGSESSLAPGLAPLAPEPDALAVQPDTLDVAGLTIERRWRARRAPTLGTHAGSLAIPALGQVRYRRYGR